MRIVTSIIAMATVLSLGFNWTKPDLPGPISFTEEVETLESDCEIIPCENILPIEEPETTPVIATPEVENGYSLTEDEIELIARVTMAEAEGECEEGQRLVIDTILNRIDIEYFPNTVYEVIYEPNQFTSMWNGRIDDCYVIDDIYELVLEELENRTNYEVCFFQKYYFCEYGAPIKLVGNHYFSGLKPEYVKGD